MTAVWSTLTDVQADAVHATAVLHLRDPGELAAELAPLLQDRPPVPVVASVSNGGPSTSPRTVFAVAEPVWALLGTTETGFPIQFRTVADDSAAVNDPLTIPIGAP